MPRYIDADALMAQLNRKKAEPCNKRYTEGFNDALMRFRSMIHSAHSVSPDEVRGVGKWVTEQEAIDANDYSLRDTCSVCGRCDWDCTESASFKYCPNCGARMEVNRE